MGKEQLTPHRQPHTKENELKKLYRGLEIADDVLEETIYRGWREYQYRTKDGGNWRFHTQINPMEPISYPDQFLYQKIKKGLKKAAPSKLSPLGLESIEHWMGTHFLHKNWERLASVFYTQQPDLPVKSVSYVNVELGKYGTADFIGLGPDGRIFVIDLAGNGKKRQFLQTHIHGINAMFFDEHVSIVPMLGRLVDETTADEGAYRLNIYHQPVNTAPLASGDPFLS